MNRKFSLLASLSYVLLVFANISHAEPPAGVIPYTCFNGGVLYSLPMTEKMTVRAGERSVVQRLKVKNYIKLQAGNFTKKRVVSSLYRRQIN